MVMFVEGKLVSTEIAANPEHVFMLIKTNMSLITAANQLKSKAVRRCAQEGLLYLYQREMAIVSPKDDCVRVVGCDGTSSSLAVVIRRPATGDASVCRFDGCGSAGLIKSSIERMLRLAPQSPMAVQFEVHVVGGFHDPRLESMQMVGELLLALLVSPFEFHLRTACVAHINSRCVDDTNLYFPVIQGVAYDVAKCELTPAEFEQQRMGPWSALRGARIFDSRRQVAVVYDSSEQRLLIEPFSYRCPSRSGLPLGFFAGLPDEELLRWCPAAEKATVGQLRATLQFMSKHKLPLAEVFGEGRIAERARPGGRWEHEAGPQEAELCPHSGIVC